MQMQNIGKRIKKFAPAWMRKNRYIVAAYDNIFERDQSESRLSPRKRALYLSLSDGTIDRLLGRNSEISIAELFKEELDTSELKFSPSLLKFSLFQLQFEAVSIGRQLELYVGESECLSELMQSAAFSLGISTYYTKKGSYISTCPQDRSPTPYDEHVSEEALVRSLQFISGLRSRRSTLMLIGDESCSNDRKLWNSIVGNLLEVSNRFDGNILIVENSAENNLSDANYSEILGRTNVALLPGKLVSEALKRRLMQSRASASYGDRIWMGLPGALPQMILRDLNRRRPPDAGDPAVHSRDLAGDYSEAFVKGSPPGPIALAQSDASIEVINGVQRYIVNAFEACGRLDGASNLDTIPFISSSSAFLQWGASESKRRRRLRRNAKNSSAPLFFIEDGFIRSVEIGLKGSPGLSFLIDDLAPYYEAREWSRIELTLGSEWKLSAEQLDESLASIDNIRRRRVSKYNHAPDYTPAWHEDPRHKILLVDQRNGDQSVPSGLATAATFRDMVGDATSREDSLVILKRHPDATIGTMGSYFSASNLGPLLSHPSVTIHDGEINPYALFDAVDEVWCVTSGMGFEALLAGKHVKVYGAPFYAGWGLTEDQLKLDWRQRTPRSLEEIFYCAYLARSVYFNDRTSKKCTLIDLVTQVAAERDQFLSEGRK